MASVGPSALCKRNITMLQAPRPHQEVFDLENVRKLEKKKRSQNPGAQVDDLSRWFCLMKNLKPQNFQFIGKFPSFRKLEVNFCHLT